MSTIEVELSKGSFADPVILLAAFVVCVSGFSLMYETDFWSANQYSWKPLVTVGSTLFAIYFYRRLFSGTLRFALATDKGSSVLFQKAEHVTGSGWVLSAQEAVAKDDIVGVKIENFYNVGTNTGMLWLCFTLKDRRVIEYSLNDYGIIDNTRAFVANALPDVEMQIGDRI